MSEKKQYQIFITVFMIFLFITGFRELYSSYNKLMESPIIIKGIIIDKTFVSGKRWEVEYEYLFDSITYISSAAKLPFSTIPSSLKKGDEYFVICSQTNPSYSMIVYEKYDESLLKDSSNFIDKVGWFDVNSGSEKKR